MDKILCDTGVISRALQNKEPYARILSEIGIYNVVINPIIRIELHRWLSVYKGLTHKQRSLLKKTINGFPILHVTENISKIAIEISDKDNSLDAPDILIGATVIYHKIPLLTANKKHFKRMKKGIKII